MRFSAHDGIRARVLLNGIELEGVVVVDTEERWIDRMLRRPDGSFEVGVDADGDHRITLERIQISRASRLEVICPDRRQS